MSNTHLLITDRCCLQVRTYNFISDTHTHTLVKTDELRKDTEVMSQTFERVVDRKDAIIKSLAKDIEEAEEQYQVALRSHLQNVDDLIGK